jgi:hypothetical protein
VDMKMLRWIRIVKKLRFNWQWETGKHFFNSLKYSSHYICIKNVKCVCFS